MTAPTLQRADADGITSTARASGALARILGRRWLVVMIVAIGCTLGRAWLVALFTGSVPYWDEWDGDADRLLRPWVEGTLTIKALLAPHNEHRILFSRLFSLLVFEANQGQWDNLVESFASCLLFALPSSMLVAGAMKEGGHRAAAVGLAVLALIAAMFPFGWENIVAGFQNCFSFLAMSGIAMATAAAFGTASWRQVGVLVAIGVAALFTMASGLIGAAAVIFVGLLQWARGAWPGRHTLVVAVSMLAVAVAGVMLLPDVGHHDAMQAVGLVDNLRAVFTAIMWPMQPWNHHRWTLSLLAFYALAMWSPAIMFLVTFVIRRRASATQVFIIGVAAWVFMQEVAMAHSRGHGLNDISSRYMDIAMLGVLCNAWLAVDFLTGPQRARQWLAWPAATLLFATLAFGLHARTPHDLEILRAHIPTVATQEANLAGYVRSGNYAFIDKKPFAIPYPFAFRLRQFLDQPTVAAMLPPPSRADLRVDTSALSLHEGFYFTPAMTSRWGHLALRAPSAGMTSFRVRAMAADGTMTQARWVAGGRGAYVVVSIPTGVFRIGVDSVAATDWLAHSQPQETARLSALAIRVQQRARRMAQETPTARQVR